jgi:uncharacterized protein YceK
MKRHFLIVLIFTLLIGCSTQYTTVRHVAPKNRNRYYNVKKDKYRKRTKIVKKKIVNQRNVVRKGPKNNSKEKLPKTEESIPNESDTTGFIP